MLDTKCAICGNNRKTRVFYGERINYGKINSKTFSARRTPDKMHYRFLKCFKCGLIFSNPVFSNKEIDNLYLKSDFNYSNESRYLKKTYFKYFKNNILNKNDKFNLKILEIGCGNGFFLEELEDQGYKNVYGIEPGRPSVKKSRKDIRKKIKVSVLKENIFPNNYFDVICCFHTLDHMVNPTKFLKITKSLLKKNGKIFFVVHNTDSLTAKMLGESSPIFDIEHIYLFNQKNIKTIFKNNYFRNLETFSIKNTYPISYWLRLFPMPEFLKRNLLNLLKLTKLESMSLGLSAGNIGITAVKV